MVEFLGVDPARIIKTLICIVDDVPYAILISDRELNEVKLKNYLQASEIFLARGYGKRDYRSRYRFYWPGGT